METLAAGSGTPIHRHASEEVIFVLKGSGTIFIQKEKSGQSPAEAEAFPLAVNSTARLLANVVHQVLEGRKPSGWVLCFVAWLNILHAHVSVCFPSR